MKKLLAVILTLSLAITALTGCGGPKVEPTDSVQAIYDLYILNKTDGVKKIGLSDKDIKEAQDTYDKALSDTIRKTFTDAGLEIDDAQLTKICDSRKAALAKMSADFKLVSKDKEKAVVTLSTTYFDEAALDTAAAEEASKVLDESKMTEENADEYLAKFAETYATERVKGYESVTASSDKKDITVNCTITDNVWMPEDMTGFGTQLGATVSGQ